VEEGVAEGDMVGRGDGVLVGETVAAEGEEDGVVVVGFQEGTVVGEAVGGGVGEAVEMWVGIPVGNADSRGKLGTVVGLRVRVEVVAPRYRWCSLAKSTEPKPVAGSQPSAALKP